MMKHIFLLTFLCCWQVTANAADLFEVYQRALISDPLFQQTVKKHLSTKQDVPISLGALLPHLNFRIAPAVARDDLSGSSGALFNPVSGAPIFVGSTVGATALPPHLTQRSLTMDLTLTQVIFDYAKFAATRAKIDLARASQANLNAASQNLIVRVANAYFAVLKDEENLNYNKNYVHTSAVQLDQIKQKYKVGYRKMSDLDAMQADYDAAMTNYIAAEYALINDKENLRALTGCDYQNLARLSEVFPLIKPQPENVDLWVKTALRQNWMIKSSRYNVEAARRNIRKQFAGHFPTAKLQTSYFRHYANVINQYPNTAITGGPGIQVERNIAVKIELPILAGGTTAAQTKQAVYDYEASVEELQQKVRSTVTSTHQSYYGVLLGIRQVNADRQSIKSAMSSLASTKASYQAGKETLVNVLNQQQKVFQAQLKYAADRYAYINNLLALKQAAGTLSIEDVCIINHWLNHDHSAKKIL